jgi:hypothetical protein
MRKMMKRFMWPLKMNAQIMYAPFENILFTLASSVLAVPATDGQLL